MSKFHKIFTLIIGSSILVFGFQNCAPEGGFEVAERSLSSLETSGKFVDVKDLDTREKFTTMMSFSQPMADRQLVESILTNVYGPGFRGVDNVANLETRGLEFGKNCSVYQEYYIMLSGTRRMGSDTEVCRSSTQNFTSEHYAFASAPRAAFLINACSQLSSHATTMNYFLTKVGTPESRNSFSTESLKNAYKLFFVGKPDPSPELLESLKFIGISQTDKAKSWSAISYTLCSSGMWQVL